MNHHAFVAWIVHLEHDGMMLAFLLDIIKVPESHTGVALAKAFQKMLESFRLQDQVHLYLYTVIVIITNPSSHHLYRFLP